MATTLVPRSLFARAAIATTRSTTLLCAQTPKPITSSILESSQRTFTTSRASRPPSTPVAFSPCSRIYQRTYASAAPAAPASSTSAGAQSANMLTWDRFLAMRGRRRFVNLGFAVAGAAVAALFGSPLIGELDLDTTVAQSTGMDPLIVIVAGSAGIAAVGWLAGRVCGGVAFSLWARQKGWSRSIAEKEKSFFDRIKRYRADPSSSSPQNPIPDYYGEKIGSVKGYRKWLKDQRTFNKKMYRGVR